MLKVIQSNWLSALIGGVLFLATMAFFWKPSSGTRPHVAQHAPPATNDAPPELALSITNPPSWDYANPEVESLVAELKSGRATQEKRQRELDDLAARLMAERNEINQITQKVHQLQKEFDQKLIRVREEEVVNLKKLAKTYITMPPESTANIFKQLDDTSVVKILAFMKESETAPILEAMAKPAESDAKRVAAISEQLRVAIPDSRLTRKNTP